MKGMKKNLKKCLSFSLFMSLVILISICLTDNAFSQYPTCTSSNPCLTLPTSDYHTSGTKWNKSNLTYYFANGTDDISGDQEKTAFYTAFGKWAAVVPLTFQEVTSQSQADIVIRYVDINTFKKYSTESPVAVGFSPPPNMCAGNILINHDYHNLSLDPNEANSKDLVYVAIHELGHVLGLCHSNNSSTVMYREYSAKRTLDYFDIKGIQEIYPSIKVKNNFSGGTVKAGINKAAETVYSFWQLIETDQTVNLEAVEQSDGEFNRVWNDSNHPEAPVNKSQWVRSNSAGSVDRSANRIFSFPSTTGDYNSEYVANLRKSYALTFISSGGSIYANGSGSSPYSAQVIEQNSVYATSTGYTSAGIEYSFSHWTKGGVNYPSIFTPEDTGTYTAVYSGKPSNSGEYASASAPVGQPIVVTWVDNPNTAVNQFQIWRRVKHNGVTGSPVLLTTVGRGVQTYTDYDYVATNGYTHDLLWYDVRAYYSTESTYSEPDFASAFGRLDLSQIEEKLITSISNELPVEYSITNYPNPFNPTTTINYQLPENGFVTIKVYDLLGKEVAALVNENKSAGYYKVNFDASRLTSGIYVYTINAGKYTQSKKMLLTK